MRKGGLNEVESYKGRKIKEIRAHIQAKHDAYKDKDSGDQM
jgi:hypothetical protein